MKRGSTGFEPFYGHGGPGSGMGPKKRPRGDKFEARLLIPSKVAGSVIGKGGANIQKLRSENNATIRIPDCPGPERVMTILAANSEQAVSVIGATLPFMTEEAVRGGPGAVNNDDSDSSSPMEIRVLIHQSIVGGVIGRGGLKIKEIRENSGSNIKVYQNCAPQSTDRCICINGMQDKIVPALTEIFDIVKATEIKGVEQPYDPINFDSYYAHEYGGYGTEMEMAFGSGSNMSMRGRSRGPDRGRFGGMGMGRPDNYRGGPRGGGFGNRGGFGGQRGQRDDYGSDSMDNFEFGNFGAPGAFGQNSNDGGPEQQESAQVTIPKEMAGAIIGPGGSRIRKIRADSRASITIDEPPPGSIDRVITIQGSKHQIQTAQYLLQQSVRNFADPQSMY